VLVRSDDVWRRRRRRRRSTVTLHFVRAGDFDDAFALAELLLGQEHDLQQQITGGVLREAGKHDPARLEAFLTRHAAVIPRRMLRPALEHLPREDRERHLAARDRDAR